MTDKRERGMYGKFTVERTDGTDGPGEKHDGCSYFVLDLTHDPLAIAAAMRYAADARDAGYRALADDLESRVMVEKIKRGA